MRNTLVSELAVVGPDHLVLAFAVDERNPRRVLAVGGQRRDYLLRSDDAGQTWTVLTSPGKGLRGAFLDGDLIWTAGEYGHVARSDDGGHTWTEYDIGFAGCLFGVTRDASGTAIIAGDNGYIAASRDNAAFKKVSGIKVSLSRLYKCNAGVFIPTDAPGDLVHLDIDSKGKVTATQHPIGPGDDLLTMTQAKHGTMVIVGKQGAIFRSTDNAQTWTRSTSPTTEMLFGVCVLDSGRFVAVGASGTVVASDDDGISFTALKVPTDGKRLWACVAVGDVVLVGGEEGRVFRLRNGHVPESVAELPAPQGERGIVPGIVVSDALRKMAWPWRGSTLTMTPRPLPTAQQAWSTLRAEIIGASAWRSVVLKKSSALLGLQIDPNAARRRLATRLANENVSAGSFVDDVALVALCFDDRFAPYDGGTRDAAIADLLVAQHGVAGAVERAIAGLRGDLPYHRMGLFERLRELVVTSSDADYAAVLALAQAMLDKTRAAIASDDDEEEEEDTDVEEVSQDLLVARRSVWSFLLPPGEKPHPVELALLERAVVTIREFGNTRIANAGLLASVDAAGFAKFLEENGDRRAHQYFSGGDRPYIATALLRGIDLVAARLSEMRPGYNLRVDRWCLLLAHVDSDAAITTLTAEPVLTLFGGRAAAALQPARFFAHLEKRRAAGEDTAVLEAALGAASVQVIPPSPALAPVLPTGAQAVATTSTTTTTAAALPRGPLVVPPALDLPIELTWRDEERTASESAMPYDGHWRWQADDVSDDDAFKEGPPLRSASAAAQERWVALREALRLPSPSAVYLLLPTKLHPRLMALGVAPEQGAWTSFRPALLRNPDTVDNVRIWMHHDGADLDDRLTVIQPLGDAWVVPAVVTGFAGKKNKALARSWILRHPRHAAAGALAMVLNDVDAVNAARVLRFVDGLGHRRTIQQLAASVDIAERVQSLLDDDPLLLQKGVKLPSIPAWAKHAALPGLKDADGTTWTPDRVDALVVRLATSNPDEVNPVVTAARQSLDKTSAATFARALFEAWLNDGADAKHVFAMHALGFFGDDDAIRHLATLAKAWPGESAAARAQMALDTFVLHGGDVALLQLAMISEKSKFAAFKKGAVERITSIADMRGLTPDELADRLVPTFGLDDEASTVIDFGARKFFIAFDESLSPRVKDESGTLLKDLPKPNKNDDATLAAAGKKQLSALKKDVKAVADLLLRRFERMMIEGRSTDVETFRASFVEHPLTFHVARRVLWEAIDDNGTRLGLFRIAEDKSYADLNDDAWTLPGTARVRPVHPIDVDDASLTKASTVWGDYELLQPFAQLGRPVHRLGGSIKDAPTSTTLSTHKGKSVPAPTLVFGLEGKGWKRYDVIDGGAFTSHVKQYGDVEAIVDYDGAVGMGYIEASENLTVGTVSLTSKKLRRSLTLSDVPPRVLSEIVTDLDAALVGKGK